MNRIYIFFVFLLILLGTIFQSLTMFRSGKMYDFGIGYWGPTARDGVWHQALVGQLKKGVPPENPGFAGHKLSNYHYYYDYLVAVMSKVTSILSADLIYRVFPILFSVLFGVGTLLLSNQIFRSKLATLFSLFFAYFGSSFGWIVEFIRERHFGGESAFWMNQPVSMNLNPPFAASMVIVIAITIFFLKYREMKTWKVALPLITLSALLIGFKVYAGVIVLGALLIVSIESFLIKKDTSYFKIAIPSIIISSFLFFLQLTPNNSFFEFKPFWFIHSMIDSPDRIGWLRLASARVNYQLMGNWPKYILAEILAITIYVIGNLGTRIIAIVFVLKIWEKRHIGFGKYSFIFWMMLIAFTIPLFFIQNGNPWNTIQFSYYFLYFAAIFAGAGVAKLVNVYPKLIVYLFLLTILTITPISSITTFTFGLYPDPPAKLSKPEYQALSYLKEQPEGVVLTFPYDKNLRGEFVNPYPLVVYDDTDYVSAYSGKAVFLGDIVQQGIFLNDFNSRLKDSKMYFAGQLGNEFLEENNIKYIYLPKIYGVGFKINGELEKIFENDESLIYQTAGSKLE